MSVRVRPNLHGSATVVSAHGPHGDGVAAGCKSFRYPAHTVFGSDQPMACERLGSHMMPHLRKGISCTLLAYGQTGSGKTHTMFGPAGCLTEHAVEQAQGRIPEQWGIMPRFVCQVLTEAGGAVQATAIEVYQDVAFDLLNGLVQLRVGGAKANGTVVGTAAVSTSHLGGNRETSNGVHPSVCTCRACFAAKSKAKALRAKGRLPQAAGKRPTAATDFQVVGERTVSLSTMVDVARLARQIEATRSAKGHDLNERSSRSHCLVRVSWLLGKRRVNVLFVDLAGSERVGKSGSTGQRQIEAAKINNSLTSLGRVVSRLAKGDTHIPFRDSCLTMLLRSSLGGRCYTSVVVNIAPEEQHLDETLCTLRFGQRMTGVSNKAEQSVVLNVEAEIAASTRSLLAAKHELSEMKAAGKGGRINSSGIDGQLLEENIVKLAALERDCLRARGQLLEAKSTGDSTRVTALEVRLKNALEAKTNHGDVVLRQKYIPGLWTGASKAYITKQAHVHELESRLQMLK